MIPEVLARQDELYTEVARDFGPAIERLAKAYEANPERRRDLMQEIHVALWRSLEGFDGRCAMRTWVYRVAHNVANTHVIRDRRTYSHELLSLEAVESTAAPPQSDAADLDHQRALERLTTLIRRLKPLDRQVILLYLEGMNAASIGEISGISASNTATKIHRIKAILARQFHQGGRL